MCFVTKTNTAGVEVTYTVRCHISLVGGNRNNDKNVWACFPVCLDTDHCDQTSRLYWFVLPLWKKKDHFF